MMHIRNGGLEMAVLEVLESDGTITDESRRTKAFLERLPKNRIEWHANGYVYCYDNDKHKLFKYKVGTQVVEEIQGDKPIIRLSIPNATGGWLHLDIHGERHFDLYCQRKDDFIFQNGCPYDVVTA